MPERDDVRLESTNYELLIDREIGLNSGQEHVVRSVPSQNVFENGQHYQARRKEPKQRCSGQSETESMCFGLKNQIPEKRKEIVGFPAKPSPKFTIDHLA